MKITKIRSDNEKLSSTKMTVITNELKQAFNKAGFITEVSIVNSSSIKIGMHMCSFRVDTNKLGYNARINSYTVRRCKAGYKKTSTPTWTQREEFNHIINNVLDLYKVKANIKSGDYTVRRFESGRVNQWEMPEVFNNGFRLQVNSVLEIVPMKYAGAAVEWNGVNAPFIGAVPKQTPRFSPKHLLKTVF